MQKGKHCLKHCNEFSYFHDFEIVFRKGDDALLEYEVLDSDLFLHIFFLSYNIFSSIKNFHIAKNVQKIFIRLFNSLRLLKQLSRSFTANNKSI